VPDEPACDKSSIDLQMVYKPRAIDQQPSDIVDGNCNSALVSWTLRCKGEGDDCNDFQIFSTLSIPAVKDSSGKEPLGCHFIKLENKPDCGCEIMSKYELISANGPNRFLNKRFLIFFIYFLKYASFKWKYTKHSALQLINQ